MALSYQSLSGSTAYESLFSRYLAVPCLLLTSILSIILLQCQRTHYTIPGHLYNFVVSNRSSTALIVQILSHILGALFVFALTSLINFRTRLTVARESVSLWRLTWWNLLCNQRLDTNLPFQYAVWLFIFWAVLLAPAALWAGAITPIVTTTTQASATTVSKYTADPAQLAWNQTNLFFQFGALNTTTIPNQGSFSFYPAYPWGGVILNTATDIGYNQTHAKHDRSRFSYSGRSYGVGSSVGLAGAVLNETNLQYYEYSEVGYDAQVQCIVNSTSAWQIIPEQSLNLQGIPNPYVALGSLPNSDYVEGENITYVRYGSLLFDYSFTKPWKPDPTQFSWDPEGYPVLGFLSNTEIVALAGLSRNQRNMFGIAAFSAGRSSQVVASKYAFLNNTQCEVTFTPTVFDIGVDSIGRTINVTRNSSLGPEDELKFDPSTATYGPGLGILAQRAMRQVMTLAMINLSVYTSVIGDVFASNADNTVSAQAQGTIDPNLDLTSVKLLGVSQSLESMLDDMLLGFSSAQLMLVAGGNLTNNNVLATVGAVKFGTAEYIYAVAVLNFVIVALLIEEAIAHRGWSGLAKFNYNDMKSVVVASSIGGSAIANRMVEKDKQRGERWIADPGDGDVGKLRVKLVDHPEKGMALIMIGAENVPLARLDPMRELVRGSSIGN